MSHPALQKLGQSGYLDGVIEIALNANLWSIQRSIARLISEPRARVVVPSCNASGKSYLGGAIPLAFYLAYPRSKVILTSSREDQLEDVLWSELKGHINNAFIEVPGHLPPREMRFHESPDHFIVAHSPAKPEGLKGYHAQHILVVVDEGSHMPEEMGQAVMSLLASGDARLLVLLNPTSDNSWAAQLTGSALTIPITAFDTPNLSAISNEEAADRWGETSLPPSRRPHPEPCPPDAALITPEHLDDMLARGSGPGSLEWETSIMARFWTGGTNTLVPGDLYDAAVRRPPTFNDSSPAYFGIDLASYGDSESVVSVRRGNALTELHARQKAKPEDFLTSVARPLFNKIKPSLVVMDTDGPGAGVVGMAREIFGDAFFPFRGQFSLGYQWLNTRSMWWWKLRNRFLSGDISIHLPHPDSHLRRQLTSLRYEYTDKGLIKVESKHSLHKRGFSSIDRADALMYVFSHDAPNIDPDQIAHAAESGELFGRAKREAKKLSRRDEVFVPRGGVRIPRSRAGGRRR